MTPEAVVVVGCVALAVLILSFGRRRRSPASVDLDRVLLAWSKREVCTMRDLLNGGLLILGMTGSGKTSSSASTVGHAVVRDTNTYGMILSAKPEDLAMWQKIFAREGQSHRLLVFDGEQSHLRLNFLAEAARSGSTRDITECITTIGETLRNGDRGGGGTNEAFFAMQGERTTHHAVEILKTARGTVTSADLQAFISGAAETRDELLDPLWRQSFHSQCLEAAYRAPKSQQQSHDCQQAIDFWCSEVPKWADRLRSSVLAGVFGTLFVFNSGLVHERVSTISNFSFDELRKKRQWLLVNTPPSFYGANGTFIGAGFKYLMQRFVLRQHAQPGDPVHICWCDEAHQSANKFDSTYIAQSRSHRGCMVFITQSIHNFENAMSGEKGKSEALALLANFSHRIIHALGDVSSAEWASDLLGARLETQFGGSMPPAESIFDEIMGGSRITSSFNTSYQPVLQPGVFLTGLSRMGGPSNGFICDAIVMRTGRRFSNGENWLKVTFSQRR